MTSRLRVAIDANVVISAARTSINSMLPFWTLPQVDILLSEYVLEESRRHLPSPEQRARLRRFIYSSHLIASDDPKPLPPSLELHWKDKPVLEAAVGESADLLVPGDQTHFGHFFGTSVLGVRIESTSMFKLRYPEHFTARSTPE